MVEDIIMDTAEAIENGYNYERVLDALRKDYGLCDDTLVKIHDLMKSHVWAEDHGYEKFTQDMEGVLS